MAEVRPVQMLNLTSLVRAPATDDGAVGAAGDLPAPLLAVLDAASLDRLRELDPGGRMGLLTRVLLTFESSVAKLLAQLVAARAAGDLSGVRHVAHTIKSSAASVGALPLSQLCAEIERQVREQDTAGLEPRLDAMVAECARLQERLRLIARPA